MLVLAVFFTEQLLTEQASGWIRWFRLNNLGWQGGHLTACRFRAQGGQQTGGGYIVTQNRDTGQKGKGTRSLSLKTPQVKNGKRGEGRGACLRFWQWGGQVFRGAGPMGWSGAAFQCKRGPSVILPYIGTGLACRRPSCRTSSISNRSFQIVMFFWWHKYRVLIG